jgi:hypothetical protein
MPKPKKPRKPYRPRAVAALPMSFALPASSRVDLQLPPHMILDAFRTGTGDEPGWHTLAAALNIGAVLSRSQPEEVQSAISQALDAIVEVKQRGDETGRWGLSGDQYRIIGAALTLSNEIQDVSTRREIRDAIDIVLKTAGT